MRERAKITNYLLIPLGGVSYLCRMEENWESEWPKAIALLEERFGQDLDLQAILFLIGLQELGKGPQKLNKDQKLDIMHVAVCTLLTPYGYYEYKGVDDDGWPHWERVMRLPQLKPDDQDQLIKRAIIQYIQKV